MSPSPSGSTPTKKQDEAVPQIFVRRTRGLTKTLLGNAYVETPEAVPETPQPRAKIQQYNTAIVKQSLSYVDQRLRFQRGRTISLTTEKALRIYKDTCVAYLSANDEATRKMYAVNMQVYEKSFQVNRFLRVTENSSAMDMMNKIVDWKNAELLARYGDYVKGVCDDLKKKTKLFKTVHWQELNQWQVYWTDIQKKLDDEHDAWYHFGLREYKITPEDVKVHLAVVDGARLMNMESKDVFNAIKLYANRNGLYHAPLEILLRRGHLYDNACQLYADLRDLDSVVTEKYKWSATVLRTIILAAIHRYFVTETNYYNSDEPGNWQVTKVYQELRTEYRQQERNAVKYKIKQDAAVRKKAAAELRQQLDRYEIFVKAEQLALEQGGTAVKRNTDIANLTPEESKALAKRQRRAFNLILSPHKQVKNRIDQYETDFGDFVKPEDLEDGGPSDDEA